MKKKPPPSPRPNTPPRYREWLTHVFDRPPDDPGWYFPNDLAVDTRFHATPSEVAALFVHTMRSSGQDLLPFSDEQVYHGLQYMISPACSDVSVEVKSAALPIELRKAVLLSIKSLYADCFEHRCSLALSHISEPDRSRLNEVCYMFWDITPLLSWHRDPDRAVFEATVLEVLEAALALENPACQESALHGLGHFRQLVGPSCPVENIVTRFIATRALSPALKAYATAAANGCVQ